MIETFGILIPFLIADVLNPVLFAFMAMYRLDVSLNMMSLGGLTLGIGLGQFEGRACRIGHMGHLNPPMLLGTLATVEAALLARALDGPAVQMLWIRIHSSSEPSCPPQVAATR